MNCENIFLHPSVRNVRWLNYPSINIYIDNWEGGGSSIDLIVSAKAILDVFHERNHTKAYQLWLHLYGVLPPIPNSEYIQNDFLFCVRATLGYSHVRHILHGEKKVLILTKKILQTIKYKPSLVCCAEMCPLPLGGVFYLEVVESDGVHRRSGVIADWGVALDGIK